MQVYGLAHRAAWEFTDAGWKEQEVAPACPWRRRQRVSQGLDKFQEIKIQHLRGQPASVTQASPDMLTAAQVLVRNHTACQSQRIYS